MRPELTPHNGHREQAHSYKGFGLFTRPLGNTQILWE